MVFFIPAIAGIAAAIGAAASSGGDGDDVDEKGFKIDPKAFGPTTGGTDYFKGQAEDVSKIPYATPYSPESRVQEQEARGRQEEALDILRRRALGEDSVARLETMRAIGRQQQANLSTLRSMRGGYNPAVARQIMLANQMMSQEAAGAAGIAAAKEKLAAEQLLAQGAQQFRASDLAKLGLSQQAEAQQNQFTLGLQKLAQQYRGLGLSEEQANRQAQITLQNMLLNQYLAEEGLDQRATESDRALGLGIADRVTKGVGTGAALAGLSDERMKQEVSGETSRIVREILNTRPVPLPKDESDFSFLKALIPQPEKAGGMPGYEAGGPGGAIQTSDAPPIPEEMISDERQKKTLQARSRDAAARLSAVETRVAPTENFPAAQDENKQEQSPRFKEETVFIYSPQEMEELKQKTKEELKRELMEQSKGMVYEYKNPALSEGAGVHISPTAQKLENSSLGKDMVRENPEIGAKTVDYGQYLQMLPALLSDLHERLKKIEGSPNNG